MIELNKIYNEENIKTISRMEDNFLDLTVTSPPYNVNLGNNKYKKDSYDLYNDNIEHKEYIKWLKSIFCLIYEKTKSGGRCIINIGDGKNGAIPTHSDIIQTMVELKWIPITTIIWNKKNTSNRAAWGSFKSPSCPSFPRSFEYILVFGKDSRKLSYKGETDLTKDEFVKWAYGEWCFPGETDKNNISPAPYPIELPLRCIKMFSWIGSIVYDPFIGSGTTAVACLKTNRNYIGSEISKECVDYSENRILNEKGKII